MPWFPALRPQLETGHSEDACTQKNIISYVEYESNQTTLVGVLHHNLCGHRQSSVHNAEDHVQLVPAVVPQAVLSVGA